VRAVENHGVRPLPFRVRSKYSPEGERYQSEARFVSLYYDAPVGTMADLEVKLRLNEQILRCSTMRTPSVVDEVCFFVPATRFCSKAATLFLSPWRRPTHVAPVECS